MGLDINIYISSKYTLPWGQMSLWGELNSLICLINKEILKLTDIDQIIPVYNSEVRLSAQDINMMIMPLGTTAYNKIRASKRIGPHNIDVYSIIYGSLLGDAHAEKREGTRITFYQESTHVTYLLWLHEKLASKEYCNEKIPEITTRLGVKGVVRKVVRFSTWTYTSFNQIQEIWYEDKIKRIPECIGEYLTPLALAIWIMDDGVKVSNGLKLCTSLRYTYSDCLILTIILYNKYNLKATVQSAGAKDKYIIYIWKESMGKLREIITPYIIPEMKYKIIE